MSLLKRSVKEDLVKKAMKIHDLKREDAVKVVRSIELQEEVRLSKKIDEVANNYWKKNKK